MLLNQISSSSLKSIIYFPLALPAIVVFFSLNGESKRKVKMDVDSYWRHTRSQNLSKSSFRMWYLLITSNKEFRNVFYCRCGKWRHLLTIFLHPLSSLFINPVLCQNYGGGLYIAHGTSTRISANKIGNNLWMHHNSTIGMIGEGRPEIGNNVYIGTGAVILGDIKIGNNVKIGANAIVIDDIPDNAIVVAPKAQILRIQEIINPNTATPSGGGVNPYITAA